MTLYIRNPYGSISTYDIYPEMTLAELYQEVSKDYIDKIVISFQNKSLPDDSTPIADTGISIESTLDVAEDTEYMAIMSRDTHSNFVQYSIHDRKHNGAFLIHTTPGGWLEIIFVKYNNHNMYRTKAQIGDIGYEPQQTSLIGSGEVISVSRVNRLKITADKSSHLKRYELEHLQRTYPSLEFDYEYIYVGDFGEYLCYEWSQVKNKNILCYVIIVLYLLLLIVM